MNVWGKTILRSRVESENVGKTEMFLGYLLGPSLMYLMISALSGTYLMQFYTDVIGVTGSVIVIMPIVSKIAVAVMNIVFGNLIGKTSTPQGKARPWLLVSGVVLPFAGILLYAIPHASYQIQVLWILFSYNFFFVIAFNIYALAHNMLLPRASRKTEERDKLSLFKNVSEGMIPGTLSAVLMPFIIRGIGVGADAQNRWFQFMLVLSIIAVPAALIEYYFTKERINGSKESSSILRQMKESFRYREWVVVILLIALRQLDSCFMSSSMIYYSNWVLGNSVKSGANFQALLNVIGQFPLGIGTFLLWPIVKKYGKYNTMKAGFLLGVIGSLIVLLSPNNFILVLIGMFIKSVGSVPTTMSISLLSDVMDRIERKTGNRYDSLGASMNSIVHNISLGLGQTAILFSISKFGYIVPTSSEQIITQPAALRGFFNFAMAGIPLICFTLSFILINTLDKKDELI